MPDVGIWDRLASIDFVGFILSACVWSPTARRIQVLLYFVNNDGALLAAVHLLPFSVIGVAMNLVSKSFLHFIRVVDGHYPRLNSASCYDVGLSMVTGYTVATLTIKPEDTVGGEVIALAVAGQVYQSEVVSNLSAALAGKGFSAQELQGAVAGAHSILLKMLDGEWRDKAIGAVTEAMQMAFVQVPIARGIMLIASLGIKWEKLFGRAVVVNG
ncbi:hypothetical protein FQN49_000828 [Arthroderma sp. PD_2]|nr:hypothetical protein FQN49_000828 [Arthroderma sp. PD_2]